MTLTAEDRELYLHHEAVATPTSNSHSLSRESQDDRKPVAIGKHAALAIVLIFSPFLACRAFAAGKGVPAPKREIASWQASSVKVKVTKLGPDAKPVIKNGKETKVVKSIICVDQMPGMQSTSDGLLFFTSLFDKIKEEKSILKSTRGVKARRAKVLSIANLSRLEKAGRVACKSTTAIPPTALPTPTVTPSPAIESHLRLDRTTGAFGAAEARHLFNRFAFGATKAEIDQAVTTGLDASVEKLLTFVPEPALDALYEDIECDSWKADDELGGTNRKSCNKASINDFNSYGARVALLNRYWRSQNGFFQKFSFWLSDERLATNFAVVGGCDRHAIRTYVNSVYRAAKSGDYMQYMRDMINDQLMHLTWLDGRYNKATGPNENWAREFWELGTLGAKNLDGTPVYTDQDVAQSALAFTGNIVTGQTVNGSYVCLAGYTPGLHAPGQKKIFMGTPYEAIVDTAEDVLVATFKHPRAAEHLAEDIWKQFINPFATPEAIRALAKVIRDNNYNLLPVFRMLMKSEALFADRSKRSLVKHPTDLVIQFLKTTEFPLYYRAIEYVANNLDQVPGVAPSVFGWDEKRLAGEAHQLAWRSTLTGYFINPGMVDMKKNTNWSYYDRFVANLAVGQQGPTARQVIDRVASELSVSLHENQKQQLEEYMNFTSTTSGCPTQCNGLPYRLERLAYDSHPTSSESIYQNALKKMISVILQSPEYRVY